MISLIFPTESALKIHLMKKGIGSWTNILLISVIFAAVYLLIGQLIWGLRGFLRRRFPS